jgi:hypothetical protein
MYFISTWVVSDGRSGAHRSEAFKRESTFDLQPPMVHIGSKQRATTLLSDRIRTLKLLQVWVLPL